MAAQPTRDSMLTRLARVNRTRAFLGALVIALAALFTPGVLGAVLLFVVVAGLAALLSVTWPVTPTITRLTRLAVLAALAAVATTKLF